MLRPRVVLAAFLLMACAACRQEAATPAPSPTTSAPSAPVSSVPPELASYSEAERAAYETALAEYDAFIKRNDAFYASGKMTGEAKDFYQKYAIDWSTAWGNLAQVVNNGVKVAGTTKTVWTKPQAVKLGTTGGGAIVVRRCLDESGRIVTQNGKTLDQPQFNIPHVYRIRLQKRAGEAWWRSGIAQQGSSC